MSMQSTQSNYNVDSSTKSLNYSKIRFKTLIHFELQHLKICLNHHVPHYHPLNKWLLGLTNGEQGQTVMDL